MMKYDYIYIYIYIYTYANIKYVQSIQVSEGIIYLHINTFSNKYNLYKYIKDYKSIVNK